MPQHLAIYPSSSWSFALIDDRAAGAVLPREAALAIVSGGQRQLAAEALNDCRLGLFSMSLADRLIAVGNDGPVLAVANEAAARLDPGGLRGCAWTVFDNYDGHDDHLVAWAEQFFASALDRFEQTSGADLRAIATATVVIDTRLAARTYPVLAAALCRRLPGVRPALLWVPTALAGWALTRPATRDAVVCGQACTIDVAMSGVREPVRVRVAESAHATDARPELITALPIPDAAPADVRVEPADAAGPVAVAAGAALWGWYRHAIGRRQVDHGPLRATFSVGGRGPATPQVPLIDFQTGLDPVDGPAAVGAVAASTGTVRFSPAHMVLRMAMSWPAPALAVAADTFGVADLGSAAESKVGVVVAFDAAEGRGRMETLIGTSDGRQASFVLPTRYAAAEIDRLAALPAVAPRPLPTGFPSADTDWSACTGFRRLTTAVPPPTVVPEDRNGVLLLLTFAPRRPSLRVTSTTGHRTETVSPEAAGTESGITLWRVGLPPQSAGASRWHAVATFRKAAKGQPPLQSSCAGDLLRAPAGYGLQVRYENRRGNDFTDAPMPLAMERSTHGRVVVAAAGVEATGDALTAVVAAEGEIILENTSTLPLTVRLDGRRTAHLSRARVELEPGEAVRVACRHRYTLDPAAVATVADRWIQCEVRPGCWATDAASEPVNATPSASELSPAVELVAGARLCGPAVFRPVSVAAGIGGRPLVVLPAETPPAWVFNGLPHPGEWRLPVLVSHGTTAADAPSAVTVRVGPVLGDESDAVAGTLALGRVRLSAALQAGDVLLDVLPARLLDWAPGPMNALAGQLRVTTKATNHAVETASVHPFTAALGGIVAADRLLRVSGEPGVVTPLDLRVLVGEGAGANLQLIWQWRGETPGPYTCLIRSRKADSVDDLRGSVTADRCLSAAALAANTKRNKTLRLAIVPKGGLGTETGEWSARIVLRSIEGVEFDAIDVQYHVRPPLPRVEVFWSTDSSSAPTGMTLQIHNANLRHAVQVSRLTVHSTLRVGNLRLNRERVTVDVGQLKQTPVPPRNRFGVVAALRRGPLGRVACTFGRVRRVRIDLEYSYAAGGPMFKESFAGEFPIKSPPDKALEPQSETQ